MEIFKENTTLQIIQQYLSVLLNKELVKIYQNSVENAQKIHDKTLKTTQIGTTAKTTLTEAESTLAKEKQNLKQAEIEVKRSLFLLSQTLQLIDYQNFDIEEIDVKNYLFDKQPSFEEVLEKILINHPIIKFAESSIKSTEIQTKILKTNFLPTISLVAGLGTFYYNSLVTDIIGVDNLGNFIKEKSIFNQYKTNFYQQIGIKINIPIFNSKNTQLQLQQAKINEEIAQNNLKIQKNELLKKIQKIYFDIENHYQSFISAKKTEESSFLALDFAEKSYEAGVNSIYDLNNTRNNYNNAKSAVVQSLYNYIFSQKMLEIYIKL